jgi:hypothetical protein
MKCIACHDKVIVYKLVTGDLFPYPLQPSQDLI